MVGDIVLALIIFFWGIPLILAGILWIIAEILTLANKSA
jgi:hypothetical protein